MSKAILGGGLSGLSAAYYLTKKLPNSSCKLFEASSRTGGWIKTTKHDGVLFEQGPRTIRPKGESGENTLELIEELGLHHDIVAINSKHPAAQNRLVYAKGSLHLLPSSLGGLFQKGHLFTKPLIMQLANDVFAQRKISQDESIYEFINRRFGNEVADYLISPMICGICAGNAKEISVNFLMKELYRYEQEYGSISRGMVSELLKKNKQPQKNLNKLNNIAKKDRWSVYSFTNGCETLPLTLSSKIRNAGVEINLNTKCQNIIFGSNRQITLQFDEREEYLADYLFSCVPANILANLVEKQHPQLAKMLTDLTKSVNVAVVNLHFDKKVLKQEAFGFLVAPMEKLPVLGVIYDSCCFEARNKDCTTLTVMMGGYWFEEHFGASPQDSDLLNTALKHLKSILKISEEPSEYQVNILRNCIPQYVVGHGRKLKEIESYLSKNKLPVGLCGASYYGVSVNDVILSAKKAVDSMV